MKNNPTTKNIKKKNSKLAVFVFHTFLRKKKKKFRKGIFNQLFS